MFGGVDDVAGGEMAVTREGRNIPDHIAVVGFDGIASAAMAGVPLTSVHVDSHALGSAAARLLVEEVEDPGHRHQRLLFART